MFIPVRSERGDTFHGATSAALILEWDQGLGLEAVLLLVPELFESQLVEAAVQLEHLLKTTTHGL